MNFAAAKLVVDGDISQEKLQQEVRRVERDVVLIPIHGQTAATKSSFWQANRRLVVTGVSILFLIAGYIVHPYFFLATIGVGGYGVAAKGMRELSRFDFRINGLMTIAVTGALIIGQWEEAAVVAVLFAVSELLETYSMDKARGSIQSLIKLAPNEATVIRSGLESHVPVNELIVGDVIVIKPGDLIPMDGEVIRGTSSVNQASITGESLPVEKGMGDAVFAGTLNQHGSLRVKVTKRVEDSTLAKMIHHVEEAQNQKAPTQNFVDRFSKVYTPWVLVIALGVAIVPPIFLNGDWNKWLYEALALLVVACPCALVVSTPVAIVTAIGSAARRGVLIKGGLHLEQVAKVDTVTFDKTGTLTQGEPHVTDLWVNSDALENIMSETDLLQVAASIEKESEHPLARAILARAKEDGIALVEVDHFSAIPGKGAMAQLQNTSFWIGNGSLFREQGRSLERIKDRLTQWQNQGKTVMIVGDGANLLGLIAVADRVREESKDAVQLLQKAGIQVLMLTGDNEKTARTIAAAVGVDEYRADLLPEGKVAAVTQLQAESRVVAMVGDGINDAPALAAATVGVAMGGAGTDTALETADIVLMGDDLNQLPFAMHLGKRSLAIIKQNVFFAIGIKVLSVLLAFFGLLTLWFAIIADMGATLLVTLNALRLLRMRRTLHHPRHESK